ncbi:oxidoreductase [Frankia sp. Cr2]|uniref:oxidoreductase n=1 Tax=Frankia sp. Cr2 TaxID=3073932 RepID=UPI002AD337EE|nr:oxidoreductase [Frankia sp. Cr2]
MAAKRWLITGVSTGLGRCLAQAALARGDTVVGTVRRDTQRDEFEKLHPGNALAEILDVTSSEDAVAAVVRSAIERAGHLDIVVNNAGYGLIGAVEEISDAEARHQLETNFFGPLKVIRAVLPHLRSRHGGHIVNVSSVAGFTGSAGCGLYNASKFALEGLSEGLRAELAPLGIAVTIVEPGAFRTEWAGRSLVQGTALIADYALALKVRRGLAGSDGVQPGDPVKAAAAVVDLVDSERPPLRLVLGKDGVAAVERKLASVRTELEACRDLALSATFEPPAAMPTEAAAR